jgi:hypothetical protein
VSATREIDVTVTAVVIADSKYGLRLPWKVARQVRI